MAKNRRNNIVPEPSLPFNERLRFSFEYYDGNRYCLSEWDQIDIKETLQRLKQVCEKSLNELRADRRVLHFHEVDWKSTNERAGFEDNRVNRLAPFQFSIVGVNSQKARVYGGLSGNTFYIVWFDYDHFITPSVLRNT